MMTRKQSRKYWVLSFIPITAIVVTLLYGFSCNQTSASTQASLTLPEAEAPDFTNESAPVRPETPFPDSVIFSVVEQMPVFPHGKVNEWIAKNVKYPIPAIEKGIQGKVYVQYVVEKDGSITNAKILKGVDASLDKEALRVVRAMPKWQPGKQKGENVNVSYTLPINFALSGKREQSPEAYYNNYLQSLEKQVEKLNDPSSWTESDRSPVGTGVFQGETDNEKAYTEAIQTFTANANPRLEQIKQIMVNLNFSPAEKEKVTQIYQKETEANLQLIKSIGSKDFIQKYAAIPHFDFMKIHTEARVALKNSLSPERHKQLVLADVTRFKAAGQNKKEVFTVVEKMPKFKNGTPQEWIAKNLKSSGTPIQGKVFVRFIIDEQGNVLNPEIIKGIDPALDQEALRVIRAMPQWNPGTQRGKAVSVSYTLPVDFKLD